MMWEDNYLAHFGVKGMRWGVRRFVDENGSMTDLGRKRYGVEGTRSSFGTGRDLNKLDREKTRAQEKADRFQAKFQKSYGRREYRAQKRGEAAPEMSRRQQKLKQKAEAYKSLADRGQKFIDKIVSDAVKSGKSVYSKDVYRQVAKGRNAVASILSGTAIASFRAGTKYKVRNNGKGVRAHKNKRNKSVQQNIIVT